jgi:protein-tyrosine phosphatase
MTEQARLAAQRLDWPACYNVRDLGGLPCGVPTFGGLTRRHALVASDYCARLNAEGWQALVAHGVRTIIDLRGTEEVAREPYALPSIAVAAGVTYQNLPLIHRAQQLVGDLGDPAFGGREYAIIAERTTANIAVILRAIITAQPGGVLIHCQAGKDRTGIIVAILLRLAGVPDELIMADYVASEPCLMPAWDALVAAAAGGEPDYRMKPLAYPALYRTLLEELDTHYGGIDGYLVHIGLGSAEITALRARLLAPRGALNA